MNSEVMNKIEFNIAPKDMVYTETTNIEIYLERCRNIEIETIASGTYRGLQFIVKNNGGIHPCVYINVKGTKLDGEHYRNIDLFVHGGVTYSNKNLYGENEGWWIGWDYAHCGDYCAGLPYTPDEGRKWNTDELIESATDAIDELLDGE